MKTSDFSFDLPSELIAQHPPEQRGTSRLMVVYRNDGRLRDHTMPDLPTLLPPGALVIINDTRVRKARLFGRGMKGGGQVEVLLLQGRPDGTWEALLSKARRYGPGQRLLLPDGRVATVLERKGERRILEISPAIDDDYLERHGHVPLPPYIRRPDDPSDGERYQTVFARHLGSAAAPTAGLHLTSRILEDLETGGIQVRSITLHVGLGTFAPIRTELVEEHQMHSEHCTVPVETARAINAALDEDRPVVAVGTTVVRTLESAWDGGQVVPGRRLTDLFIRPGYRFGVVRALLTNFHTPHSSLLVMVSAFAGLDVVQEAYRRAVEGRYRFFSYGDAMLIL